MAEWWTYSLADFLLFSPHTYYRLFALHNGALWPAQLLAVAIGAAVLAMLRSAAAWAPRAAAAILAAAWLFVAWAFLLERYAAINWAAVYFAWGFALQALLLATAAGLGGFGVAPGRRGVIGRAARVMIFFAVFLHPLVAPLAGRDWREAEIFGVAPDPTVIATLGLVLLARPRVVRVLLPLPLAWCAVSGATQFAMKSPDWFVMPAAGLMALVLAFFARNPETLQRV